MGERLLIEAFRLRGYIGGMGVLGGKPTSVASEEVIEVQKGTAVRPPLRIRVLRGEGTDNTELPCVVSIFGSAFYGRFDGPPCLLNLTNECVVVVIEHRGSRHGGVFPEALHDVVAAVRHVRGTAQTLGIDPDRIAAFGDSSGGWFALMLAVMSNNPQADLLGNLGDFPGVSAAVTCAIALFPPTKFDDMDNQHRPQFHAQNHDAPDSPEAHFMGFPVQSHSVDHASPITYVTHDTPPIFLAHGDSDPLVPSGQSRLLYERLLAKSHNHHVHHFHEIHGAGHATPQFADPSFALLIFEFLREYNRHHLSPPADAAPSETPPSPPSVTTPAPVVPIR